MGVLDHKCPSCGSPLKFNPKIQKWDCKYCNGEFTLEQLIKSNSVKEVNFNSKFSDVYNCPDCGASVVTDKYTSSTNCVYCGNVALIKAKLSNEFKPDKILPFKIDKNDVIDIFLKHQKKNPFMPKLFNKKENIEKITGIYVPFWLVNSKVNAKYEFLATLIREWSIRNKDYIDKSVFELKREAILEFNDIPLDGSVRFNDDMMHSLEPFDFKELKDFNYAYLSGFLAEIYDSKAEDKLKGIEDVIKFSTEELLKEKEKGYNSLAFKNKIIDVNMTSAKYALLPVWMVNVTYKNQKYLLAVNGQTGKMIGHVPLDFNKICLSFIIIAVVIYTFLMGLAL